MGELHRASPVLLLLAAFSRREAALAWACDRATQLWGPPVLVSGTFDFSQTDYYEPTMGPNLRKKFFAFAEPIDPGELVGIKLDTNRWEQEYAAAAAELHAEPRPLNLDPGYVDLGKLVLASTKDNAHRIYLGRGIYAEVTLQYTQGHWRHHRWTFADYRRDDYQRFFTECRSYLHRRRKEEQPG